MYNSAVATWAISAAWELGALDELHRNGRIDIAEFAAARGLDAMSTVGMFRALAAVDVVRRGATAVTPAANFAEVDRNKSFFHWLSRGSAELFRRMPSIMATAQRVGDYYERDAVAIAYACREIDELCYAPTFWDATKRAGFTYVADLGCGSGGRLIDMMKRYPNTRGIGIDIARGSLEVARKDAATAGLGDRLTFVEGDVRDLEPERDLADVDLITCFMMGHDFWPREDCLRTLGRLREVFPSTHKFLLGDATRTVGVADADLPVFTLGFEVGHDLMGTFIPTLDDWESMFEQSDWKVARTNRIGIAVGEVVFELEVR
jgi:phenylpyruvate C(3)-methyltransferase